MVTKTFHSNCLKKNPSQTAYPIGYLHLPMGPQVWTLVPSWQTNLVLVLSFLLNFNDDSSTNFDGGGIWGLGAQWSG
jgi:hypothetical protein